MTDPTDPPPGRRNSGAGRFNPRNWRPRTRFQVAMLAMALFILGMIVTDWHQRSRFPSDEDLLVFFQETALTGPLGGLADPAPFAGPVMIHLPDQIPTPAGGLPATAVTRALDDGLPVFAGLTGLDFLRLDSPAEANIRVVFEMDGNGPERRVRVRQDTGRTVSAEIILDMGRIGRRHDQHCTNPKDDCIDDTTVATRVREAMFAGLFEGLGLSGRPRSGPSVLDGMTWPTGHDLGALALLYHPRVMSVDGPLVKLSRAGDVVKSWPEFGRVDAFLEYLGVKAAFAEP